MFHSIVCAFVCGALGLAATPIRAQAQTFHGTLDRSLRVDSRVGTVWNWTNAPETLANRLGLDPARVTGLYQGELYLGLKPALHFGAAVAELKDGSKLFFIDRQTGNGALVHFDCLKFQAPSQTYYSAQVNFDIRTHGTPFERVPVFVALPTSTEGGPGKPGELTVIVGQQSYVEGTVMLPGRKLLVRYAYDLDTASVSLDKAMEWFDIDGNGTIDIAAGSPERGVPDKEPPVFDLGSMALQTQTIDLATHSTVLKQVVADAQRINLRVGSRIPDFTYQDLQGKQRKLSEVKSKYTLLDFWATWCAPCVGDLPSKREAYDRFHEKGFEILGMNGDPDTEKPEALLKKLKITWPEAKSDQDLLQHRFKINQWPTLVLIDASGTILSTSQAEHLPLSGPDLQRTLETLLP